MNQYVSTPRMRIRWRLIALGIVWMILVGGGMGMGLRTERFFCERTAGDLPICTLSVSGPFECKTVLPPETIGAAEMVEYKKSNKSPTVYIVTLFHRNGSDTPIVRHSDRAAGLRTDKSPFSSSTSPAFRR